MGGGESHHSGVADWGEKLDPTSYAFNAMGSVGKKMNPHTYLKPIATTTNKYLSKVTKPLNQTLTAITPGKAELDNSIPLLKAWNQTVENRPADAAGIAAATFFSGGALAGAMGGGAGAAGAAAPAASGGAGAMGGMGTATGAAGASSITPAFASGIGAGGAGAGVSSGLGFGSLGTLGASGTAAGTSMLTPAFASQGAASGGMLQNLFGNMTTTDKIKLGKNLADMLNQQSGNSAPGYDQQQHTSNYHNYHNY